MPDILVKKPLDMIREECDEVGEHTLKRALGPTNLIALGIGAIIGTGIFVLTGQVAAQNSGPAVVLSFPLPESRVLSPACVMPNSPR
jgi:APA family basic amino acid/polyamine antiporter